MNQLNQAQSTLSQELGLWVRAYRDIWSADRKQKLETWKRILYSVCGAFSYFFILFLVNNSGTPDVENNKFFFDSLQTWGFFVGEVVVPTVFFGWLVGSPSERCGGPIRLYLDGVLLPAITSSLILLPLTYLISKG